MHPSIANDPDRAGSRLAVVESAPGGDVVRLVPGIALIAVVLGLGVLGRTAGITRWGLRIDESIAGHLRTESWTAVAAALTRSATPEVVGIAVVVLPLALAALRRWADAVRALCVLGGALALAVVAKWVIAEPRPPSLLWAIPADSGDSYPSGHTAVAAAIVVALVVVARTRRGRAEVVLAGGVYTLAVAASRVYLANHYPLDVIGSLLDALAAGFVVAGLTRLAVVHRWLSRLDARSRRRKERHDLGTGAGR